MGAEPKKAANKWPPEEDRFHTPYVEPDAVDSAQTVAIGKRNQIRAGDDSLRTPPRTGALKALFPED